MSGINLSIDFEHPAAIANQVQYARIDNTVTPTFITVSPNIAGSSGSGVVIATNVPNGQYQVNITPIYADGRSCAPTIFTTPPCDPLISINAVITSGNIVVSYLAPSTAPKVRITVNYPNGGSFVANFVNNGNNIVIPLPAGQTGTFLVAGQTVCDEVSGFYSAFSSQVALTVTAFNVVINNFAPGITISNVTGISGFVLPMLVPPNNTATGNHLAFFGGIVCTFTGTPSGNSDVVLEVNNTIIQCQNVPNTAGGTVTFSPANFAATDLITITFSPGLCP
jgi:hypothetical protein